MSENHEDRSMNAVTKKNLDFREAELHLEPCSTLSVLRPTGLCALPPLGDGRALTGALLSPPLGRSYAEK